MSASQSSILNSQFGEAATPCFLVDLPTVRRNCERMLEKARASGVRFRPHVKTHKTLEIGRMQHGGETGPITVSTLAEAEFFADGGFRDITYAVPIAPSKFERAAAIAARIDHLNLLIDSEGALTELEVFSTARGVVSNAFLKIDCGTHRAGIDPENPDSVRLALRIGRSETVRFRGLLAHAGHSYDASSVDDIRRIAGEEAGCVTRFRALLAGEGLGHVIRSIGSTPTASLVDRFAGCDEVRPGNYVFFDAFQTTIGSCAFEDVAVSVLATVVGSYPERGTIIVDAGALALSKDRGPEHVEPGFGYGLVCDLDLQSLPMRIVSLSQEHGRIETRNTVPVGTRLRILPNHSCLTAAMFEEYHVLEGGDVVDRWKPVRGW